MVSFLRVLRVKKYVNRSGFEMSISKPDLLTYFFTRRTRRKLTIAFQQYAGYRSLDRIPIFWFSNVQFFSQIIEKCAFVVHIFPISNSIEKTIRFDRLCIL